MGQISRVPPARSTRVGAFDSIRKLVSLLPRFLLAIVLLSGGRVLEKRIALREDVNPKNYGARVSVLKAESYFPCVPAARLRAINCGPSFFAFASAGFVSKQRRQRASYIPEAPTTISSSLSTSRCVCTAGLPQRTHIASNFVISSAIARRRGIGSNGRPR